MKRDRQIQIFSLSFLDTFCCALGAMILLFILNSQILSRTVKQSAARYQAKAAEAWQERTKAEKERQLALELRDQALLAKNLAQQSQEAALQAEQKAAQSQREAMIFQQQAQQQRDAAQKAEQLAKAAQLAAEAALKDAAVAQEKLEASQQNLANSNAELIKINQILRDVMNENKTGEQKLKDLTTQYDALLQDYQALKKAQQDNQNSLIHAKGNQSKLQSQLDQITQQYQQIQTQLQQAKEQLQATLNQNQSLQSRLELKNKETKAQSQSVQSQAETLRTYEQRIETLQQQIAQNAEKSLFGIKLQYHKVVILLDRSGSITSNNWKPLVIKTCSEILQHCDVDEFAIIAFSSEMLFYPHRRGMTAAGTKEEKEKAIRWVEKDLPFEGATHLRQALQMAYEDYGEVDAIFILTDGLPEERGHTSLFLQDEIVKNIRYQVGQKNKAKIIAISIGYPPTNAQQYIEIYKYLHRIAELTGGQYLGK